MVPVLTRPFVLLWAGAEGGLKAGRSERWVKRENKEVINMHPRVKRKLKAEQKQKITKCKLAVFKAGLCQ